MLKIINTTNNIDVKCWWWWLEFAEMSPELY